MEKTPNLDEPNMDMNSEKKIKYPLSGVAPNLIDKFLVLGYDPQVIEHSLQYNGGGESQNDELKTRFEFFSFSERPTVVNEICNDYSKDLLENDLILELIYPNSPSMYFLRKERMNEKKEIDEDLLTATYSIIFSINPQDNSGSKKSYNGLGYIFYVPLEHKTNEVFDGLVYVPIAYVILSEFPYFYHFKEICRNVCIQMKKEHDEIPIEIILYNIVKYLQSPINKSINLTFAAPIAPSKDKGNNFSDVLYPLYSLARDDNRIPTMFFHQLSGYPFMDINISFLFNLIPPEIIVEVFIFSFLEHDIIFYSSRPEILNMVMYIFSNLNYPFNDSIYYWHVLSVSQENFMNGTSTFVGKTCSTLTGILSEYDSSILTTSKIREHFVLDIDNKNFFFLFQEETDDVKDTIALYTYIKNCAQDADDTTQEAIKVDKETKIKTIFNDGIQLYDVIKNLMEELNRRSKKVTSTNYNEKAQKPSFLTLYEDESEMDCVEANLRLQKAFFTFIAQISQNFVSILFIDGDKNKDEEINLSIGVRRDDDLKDDEEENKRKLASKAGRIFKKKFIDCSKYSSFVINFCQYHDTIDLYKIPYTFINEFIYYSHVAVRNNLSEVDVFKLIDQFYGKRKLISFDEIIKSNVGKEGKEKKDKKDKKKEKEKIEKKNEEQEKANIAEEADLENVYVFNFKEFVEYYKENLRGLINREQEDDKDIFTKVATRNFKVFKRTGYFLSNKLLNIYMNISNNNYKSFLKFFSLIKCVRNIEPNVKNKNQIKNEIVINENIDGGNLLGELLINRNLNKLEKDLKIFGSYEFNDITDVIERHFIIERCFSSYGLIKFSLLNILAITRGFENQKIKNPKVMSTICDFCDLTKSLARKYMNIFLNIFQELNFNKIMSNKKEFTKCYKIIYQYFAKSNMLPTEETTKTMNTFNEKKKGEAGIPAIEADELKKENGEIKDKEDDEISMYQFIHDNGKFFDEKIKKKKFDEMMKTIETIFTGNYSTKTGINAITYKELTPIYNRPGVKEKDKFLPKTPLNLYCSSNGLLNKYMNNNFVNDKKDYEEILYDLLSLLFYFKIPVIGEKWIEHYKTEKEKLMKEKSAKKKETKIKNEEETKETIKLKEIISVIIAIIINLIDVIEKDM